MGGLPLPHPYRSRHLPMNPVRSLFWFVVGLLIAVNVTLAHAGTIPYKFNGMNVTREGGATYLRGTSPSEVAAAGVTVENAAIHASGSANWYAGTGALLQSGGVVFNAVVPIAAAAASVAVTAVRLNPSGLITSAVASYLLTKGIEFAEGQFQAVVPGTSTPASMNYVGTCPPDYWNSVRNSGGACSWGDGSGVACAWSKPTPNSMHVDYCGNGANWYLIPTQDGFNSPCPSGQTYSGGNCVGNPTRRPATDSDWDAARQGYWPDPAILDLVRRGVALPTDKAVFTPQSQDVPVSDPYVDPVTGKRFQDKARVTPSPSAPDMADVQVVKQEIDANGNPVIVNGQAAAPQEQTDLCKLHPEILACATLDTPGGPDLSNMDKSLSITPDSGWGPDTGTCPADKHLTLRNGHDIPIEYGPACQVATSIRPVLIAFAWLAAILIAVGITRKYAQ